MAGFKGKRLKGIVILVAVCIGSAMIGFVLGNAKVVRGKASNPPSSQSSDEKEIERYERPGEPFRFGNLSIGKTKVALRQKFSAKSLTENSEGQAEDWLENLEFSIKNIASNNITFILVQLQFPETEVNGPKMVYNLHMGVPVMASEKEIKSFTPLALAPGKSVTFALSSEELKLLKRFLATRHFQLVNLNRLVIRIVSVVFDDGMKWEMDYYFRPNPNLPGGYERVNNRPVDR